MALAEPVSLGRHERVKPRIILTMDTEAPHRPRSTVFLQAEEQDLGDVFRFGPTTPFPSTNFFVKGDDIWRHLLFGFSNSIAGCPADDR